MHINAPFCPCCTSYVDTLGTRKMRNQASLSHTHSDDIGACEIRTQAKSRRAPGAVLKREMLVYTRDGNR
jgi:hypothetical protein